MDKLGVPKEKQPEMVITDAVGSPVRNAESHLKKGNIDAAKEQLDETFNEADKLIFADGPTTEEAVNEQLVKAKTIEKKIVANEKEVQHDKEDIKRFQGSIREGETALKTKPVEEGGRGEVEGGGILFRQDKEKGLTLNTPFGEITGDSATRHAKLLSNLSATPTLFEKGYASLNIPTRQNVLSGILTSIQNDKIFRTVVPFVPIDVVNNLIGQKWTVKDLARNKSMLIRALRSSSDTNIVSSIMDSIVRSPAFNITKVPSELLRRWPVESFSTKATADEVVSKIPSMSHKNIITEPKTKIQQLQTQEEIKPAKEVNVEIKEPWQMTKEEFRKEALYRGIEPSTEKNRNAYWTNKIKYAELFGLSPNSKIRVALKRDVHPDIKGKWDVDEIIAENKAIIKREEIHIPKGYELPIKAEVPIGEDVHKFIIQQALSEGKPVPPEVLKDYTDLIKAKEETKPKAKKEIKPAGGIPTKELSETELEKATREAGVRKEIKEKQVEIPEVPKGIRRYAHNDIVGHINEQTANKINKLGFSTESSPVIIPQKTIDYIEKNHPDLTDEDISYLKEIVDNPSEILPNIGEEGKEYRINSVFLIKQNGKDYVSIVEITPGVKNNKIWNFWKMSRNKADKYLKKFRDEKARIVQSGGRPLPHIPLGISAEGQPEGLSGSQTENPGSNLNILPIDENVKSDKGESITLDMNFNSILVRLKAWNRISLKAP